MSCSAFEKSIYKDLFDRFQKDESHVEFLRSEYDGDFEDLRNALKHLSEKNILFLIDDQPDSLTVELTPEYCYCFVEL